jgi:hypothetical protein
MDLFNETVLLYNIIHLGWKDEKLSRLALGAAAFCGRSLENRLSDGGACILQADG